MKILIIPWSLMAGNEEGAMKILIPWSLFAGNEEG
jgi:hypothetical protein